MEKRPKFKVGDKVYVVYQSCSEYYRVIEIKIDEISIRRDNYITYSCDENLSWNGYELERYEEQDCFLTKEEAQKECDRRNVNCDECGDIDCEDCAKFKKGEE